MTLTASACSAGVEGLDRPNPANPGMNVVPEAPTVHHSGQRLRARLLDAGAGASQFLGWHDTTLGVDCRFVNGADDVLRCLPTAGTALYFDDTACTQALVGEDPCATSDLVSVTQSLPYDQEACAPRVDSQSSVYRRGDPVAPARLFRRDESGRCVELGPQGLVRYRRAQPVALEMFVAASLTLEPQDDRLSAWVARAQDDSVEVMWLHDRGRAADCILPYGGFGDDRCLVPSLVAYASAMPDQTCKATLAYGSSQPACARPEVIFDPGSDTCGQVDVRYYEVGPEATKAGSGSVEACTVVDIAQRSGYFERGAEDQSDRWPPLYRRRVGTGGVQIERFFSATGEALPTLYTPFVLAEGPRCLLLRSEGDPAEERCVPGDGVTEVSAAYFSDPACRSPLAVLYLDNSGACAQPPPRVTRELPRDDACAPYRYALYHLGDRYEGGASLYQLSNGTCSAGPVPHGAPNGRVEVFHLGDPVDLSSAPRLTYRLE